MGVPADQDNLPARVALHDDVLAAHSAQLADHGDRLDRAGVMELRGDLGYGYPDRHCPAAAPG